MPAPATIDDFLDVVRKSNQVDTDRLDAYLVRQREEAALPPEPRKLAAQLIRAGLMTTFQAEQFLQGKYKGFNLGGYRLIERLGAGGTGTVYLAEHEVMKRRVALKVLAPAVASDPKMLERFRREAQASGALDHPNIVRAYDFRQEGQLYVLVMEYVKGPSLQQVLDKQGPLEVAVACDYVSQAALGLQHAHEAGMVHRDIKPANLLVDASGIVKILDMGLARFAPEGQESVTRQFDENTVMGTADYLAPEQGINLHNVDHRADIYSLGATLYALLAGEPPFNTGTITQKLLWHQMREPARLDKRVSKVPVALGDLVASMMAKSPDDRPQTAARVVSLLAPFCSGTLTPQAPPSGASLSDSGASRYVHAPAAPVTPSPSPSRPPNDALTTPRPWQRKPEPEPLREEPLRRSPEPRHRPAVDSNLMGILLLVGVMTGVLLLVGGVLAFIIWGPSPTVPSQRDPTPPPEEKLAPVAPPPPVSRMPDRLPDIPGELFALTGHKGRAERVLFAADGRHVVSGGDDQVLRVWNVLERRQVRQFTGHTGRINFLSFNRKGDRLLSASDDGSVRLWNYADGKPLKTFAHKPKAWTAVFGKDDNQILVSGEPPIVDLWDASGRKSAELTGHTSTVNWLAIRPGTKTPQVASASWDKTVKLWDLDRKQLIRDLTGHAERVNVVAITPDGKRAVTGSTDRKLKVWDLDNGKLLRTLDGHTGGIWAIAISPDGKRAVSGGADRQVRLWDLTGYKLVLSYAVQPGDIPGLAFAPSGKHFVSCCHDGSVRLWGVPPS